MVSGPPLKPNIFLLCSSCGFFPQWLWEIETISFLSSKRLHAFYCLLKGSAPNSSVCVCMCPCMCVCCRGMGSSGQGRHSTHTTKQFLDASCISCNSTQFWLTLYLAIASDSTGSVSQDVPHFKCQLQIQVVTCTSDQLARNQVSTTPSWGLINFLEQYTGLRKPVDSLDQKFITKDIKRYESRAV